MRKNWLPALTVLLLSVTVASLVLATLKLNERVERLESQQEALIGLVGSGVNKDRQIIDILNKLAIRSGIDTGIIPQ